MDTFQTMKQDEVRKFFARRSWLREYKKGIYERPVITDQEYELLKTGHSLPLERLRDLSIFIQGYLRARE